MATRKYSNKRKRKVNRFDTGGITPFNTSNFGDYGLTPQGNTWTPRSDIQSIIDSGDQDAINQLKIDITGDNTSGVSGGLSNLAKGAINGAGDLLGQTGYKVISGGLNSGAGNAIMGFGSATGDIISTVNPVIGGAVKLGSGLVGGITNALFGSKLNQERINNIEGGVNQLNNIQVDDSSTGSILNQFGDTSFGQSFNMKDIGKDGLFSNKAKNTYKRLKKEQATAINRALGNFSNAAGNVQENQVLDSMANYAAYGGPIIMRNTGPMSPFGNTFAEGGEIYIKKSRRGTFTAAAKKHGKSVQAFASQVLANKDNYSPAMVKKANFARNASKWHSDGGWLDNTHGGIFDNGVVSIGNGGTHEQNPFEGIQMGVDEQGIPNLVEEGEVIFNDYVYSNRLKAPKEVKKKYKLRGETFADLAENAQKESEERPFDSVSQRGLQDIMSKLAMEQESIKERRANRSNKFAEGGNLDGFTYGVNMLNLDKNINTADLYKQGSNYMKARQYVLDNWDTPYVQNWIDSYYKPFVTKYNESRGYKGSFNVNRDQFEKGTYDSNFGGMHQGLINFQYPSTGVAKTPTFDDIVKSVMDIDRSPLTIEQVRQRNSNYDKPVRSNKNGVNPLTYLRFIPALGGAVGATMGLASKPDYSHADALLEASKDAGRYIPVEYSPIGNYLTYNPFDRDYYINKLAAQAGATRRAITGQSAGNRATAMAGLLAADYNAQNSLGNLARQAQEYNFNTRKDVETFNRATDMFNSEMALKAAMANQDAFSRSVGYRLNGTAEALKMKQAIDDARSASISANLSNLFNSLGDIGREEVAAEWIKNNPGLYYYFSRNGGGEPYKGSKKSLGGYITRPNKKRRKK